MILDHTGHMDRRPGHVATLPMKTLPRFSPQDLHHEVHKIIAASGAEVTIEPSLTSFDSEAGGGGVWSRAVPPPAVGLCVNGITIAVTGYDRPGFTAEEVAVLDPKHWETARSVIARCRAHLEISEVRARISPDLDHNHDRAVAMTIVAIAVARLVEVEGIVWHASLRCLGKGGMARLGEDLANDVAPVELWVGLDRFPARAGHSAGVATRGLFQLLGAEIEVGQGGFPPEAAFDIALDLAERIISDGSMPAHASRLSFGLGREFVVRHMPRGTGNEAPALALTPDSSGQVAGAA